MTNEREITMSDSEPFHVQLKVALEKADYVYVHHDDGSLPLYEIRDLVNKDHPSEVKQVVFYDELPNGECECLPLVMDLEQTIQIDQKHGCAEVARIDGKKVIIGFLMRRPFGPDDI